MWFRAFDRTHADTEQDARDVLAVLQSEDRPHPNPNAATRQKEVQLGIAPPRVYMYLGRTKEFFGRTAFVLGDCPADAEVSPFDTGDLLSVTKPVNGWPNDRQRELLRNYTWPIQRMAELLEVYPGTSSNDRRRYLSAKPTVSGLHELLPNLIECPIWKDNDDWSAWTWEARTPSALPIGRRLLHWSTEDWRWAAIQDLAISADADTEEFISFLAPRYRPGGVSPLVAALLEVQCA
jgi:hypothetical protein